MNVIVQLGTTVVASAASPSPSVAFARMQQPHAMQKVAVVTVPKPCTVVEPLVQSMKTEVAQAEEKVDVKVKVEELQQPEDLKPTTYHHSPLDHATTKEQRLEILKLVLQDHNYVAPPVDEPPKSAHGPPITASSYVSSSMYPYGGNVEDDDANSVISSGTGREVEPEGEETETAPEGEGDDDDSVTRCICDFQHDDGYMICCDKCFVWQHVDCMQIDRANIPELYSCERCQPRKVDKQRARTLQMRKREELFHVDSSTDSSSSSSPDCATLRSSTSTATKKRGPVVPPSTATTSRRKSEPGPSGGQAKSSGKKSAGSKQPAAPLPPPPPLRQRRESTTKEQRKAPAPVIRRKESKRMPVRRKSKSRTMVSDSDDDSDMEKPSSVQELRQWIEHYEEAVTNHYSPELRARISSIKVNGIHSDLRVGSLPVTPKCRTTILGSGLRILYAAANLPSNQPVIELRGKYMLSIQHHASVSMQNSRRVRLPPGPYIFFYRLPKDGTEVCVDTSTYGNDARFVRRSCRPNAEMRHCIEKGTLHLYLVTLSKVDRGAEITIAHDSSQENLTPISCACGNPSECLAFSRKNGLHEQISDREKRRRVRRSSTNDGDGQASQSPAPAPVSPSKPSAPVTRRSSAVRSPVKQAPPPRPATPPAEESSSATSGSSCSPKARTDTAAAPPTVATTTVATVAATTTVVAAATTTTTTTTTTSTAAVVAVSPSERKAAASSSVATAGGGSSPATSVTTAATTAVTTTTTTAGVNTAATTSAATSTTVTASTSTASTPSEESNKKLSREDRKMAAILKAIERMEQQSQKKEGGQTKQAHRRESEPVKKPEPKPEVKPDPPKKEPKKAFVERPRRKRRRGRTRTNSTSTRRSRRDSVDSEGSSGEEGAQGPVQSSPGDSQEPTESPGQGLSTAAGLLLALANATTPQQNPPSSYRPHTPPSLDKLNSETLGGVNPTLFSSVCDSGGGSSSQGSTPPTPLSSACLLVAAAVDNLAPGFKFPKTKKALMNEWLNQPPTPPEVMVDSALALSHNKCLVQGQGVTHAKAGSGSAKKRWLRQAISEEGEVGGSPNSRAESPPGSDCVPPLKKRRFARESMSSEQSVTPPLTPTQTVDSFLLKEGGTARTTTVPLSSMCEDDDDEEEAEESTDAVDEVEVLEEIPRVGHHVEEDNSNGTEEDVCRGFEQTESILPRPELAPLSQPALPSLAPNPQDEEEDDESESESALSGSKKPAKRKLSISEYWQRKQRGSCSEPMKADDDAPMPAADGKQIHRSSSSSSLSSDDEPEHSSPALTNLPVFSALDSAEEKKGGEDLNYMKWNSAPTMVEQQRENLTERLRREFGLFLSDDEEQERVRKQQSQNTEVAVKESKKRAPPPPPPPHPPPPDSVQPQLCHGYASPHVGYSYPAYAMMAGHQPPPPPPPPPPPGRFSASKKPYLLPTPPGNPVYNSHTVYASGSNGSGRPGAANSSAFLTAAAAKAYFPANHP
ncbi:treacle protein-like isoform X2 [Bacillus rossius redtenbacheri]|uniref:treacle protein-like isoform X2 n=1 Tax=Bacillus rossius redtenbacheri TaxID=93214 RepID=UPI002FDD90E2